MRHTFRAIGLVASAFALVALTGPPAVAHDPNSPEGQAEQAELLREYIPTWKTGERISGQPKQCVNGKVDKYPCQNVDLLSFLPQAELGGGGSSSMWYWNDAETNNEYILYCRSNGMSFINVTDPVNPRYLGNLPAANGTNATWCDVRTYKNFAYIGKDAVNHGIQVFDLHKLRGLSAPQTFTADAHFSGLTNSHTLWINEKTGFLYVSGANTCKKGLTIYDIKSPLQLKHAACYDKEVYSHEAVVVNYDGPDTRFTGREIAFNYTGQGKKFQILDVTDKANIKVLSTATYNGASYVHQGYHTKDFKYLIQNDETIPTAGGSPNFVWNIEKLDNAKLVGRDNATRGEFISHNGYTVGDKHYQAAYKGGLRIIDTAKVGQAKLDEVGYFDTDPASNASGFSATWMAIPYLKNGVVAVQSMGVGLYLVKPTGAAAR
ncbi:choice-of-anchor B family protein [Pilimelia columellifera]|uniref:Choice-of-anchor B family protein n=1 Tax=Pilimelia columellifera subsp. columellifera TaxID=706583 RepID=A0ABP6ALA1_9ACTN